MVMELTASSSHAVHADASSNMGVKFARNQAQHATDMVAAIIKVNVVLTSSILARPAPHLPLGSKMANATSLDRVLHLPVSCSFVE